MAERTETEGEASEGEVREAVDAWFAYLDKKLEAEPEKARGIVPTILNEEQSPTSRIIQFSLVPGIAPELAELGQLTPATKPHVYVNGLRHRQVPVNFGELYDPENLNPSFDGEGFMPLFFADLGNRLPDYLKNKGVNPADFLLFVDSSDDFDHWGDWGNVTRVNLVFLTNENEGHLAISINQHGSSVAIKPATVGQMEIIRKGFNAGIESLKSN